MKQFSQSNASNQAQFDALVKKDEELFAHEERLAESTSGILVPGSSPTPPMFCPEHDPSSFALFLGDNTILTYRFPYRVMSAQSKGPIITLDRRADGSIAVIMDIRDPLGKIVARLDKNGYVIGSRLSIEKPDRSTLIVVDEYGEKALEIRYINPSSISLDGYISVGGKTFRLQLPMMHNGCIVDSYGTAVEVH
jgi:hypothetical protein